MDLLPNSIEIIWDVPDFLVHGAVRSTIVLGVAGLLGMALRRRAEAAHLNWALALTASLVLPPLLAILPAWSPFTPSTAGTSPAAPDRVSASENAGTTNGSGAEGWAQATSTVRVADLPREASMVPQGEAQLSLAAPLAVVPDSAPAVTFSVLAIWFVGSAVAVLPLIVGSLQLLRLRRSSERLDSGRVWEACDDLTNQLGMWKKPSLLVSDRRDIPMTWGIAFPVVLLPKAALQWSDERLDAVLRHELAHIQRFDCFTQLLGRLAAALYWFNPLAWWGCARLRLEQERACDDRVLNAGREPADYAEHLLAVTTQVSRRTFPQTALAAAGRYEQIRTRLVNILDVDRDHRPLSTRSAAWSVAGAMLFLIPLGSMQLAADEAPAGKAAQAAAAPDRKQDAPKDEKDQDQAALLDARTKLLQHYPELPDRAKLTEGAIKGMVKALGDVHADYLDVSSQQQLERGLGGKLQGVGLMLERPGTEPRVVRPLPGSPAQAAGLRPGDIITEIDGQKTLNVDLLQITRRITGQPGSSVTLKYRRDDTEREVTLQRAEIKIESVQPFARRGDSSPVWMLDDTRKIGYIHVVQFDAGTASDFEAILAKLKERGCRGLVLDLRYCPGGLLNAAVEVVGKLMKDGEVVTIREPKGEPHRLDVSGMPTFADVPLIVLINEHTASAAEVLAGSLQAGKRATLLGTRTHGKGSIQRLIPVEGGGALKVTMAHFELPGGRRIDRRSGANSWGVDPDDGFYVPLSAAEAQGSLKQRRQREVAPTEDGEAAQVTPKLLSERYSDPQLAAGLEALIARLEKGSFPKVGQAVEKLAADMARGKPLLDRKEALLKEIESLDRELADLVKPN